MIKLTEEDMWFEHKHTKDDKCYIEIGFTSQDFDTWHDAFEYFREFQKQILDDYKKARKYDEIQNGTLGFIRAFNWLDQNKSMFEPADENARLRILFEHLTRDYASHKINHHSETPCIRCELADKLGSILKASKNESINR